MLRPSITCFALLFVFPVFVAQGRQSAPESLQLVFPTETSVGDISVSNHTGEGWDLIGSAKGAITVPVGKTIRLSSRDIDLLATVDVETARHISGLELLEIRLDESAISVLSRFPNIVEFSLRKGSVSTSAANANFPWEDSLTTVHIDASESEQRKTFLQWLTKARSLKSASAFPSLNQTDLEILQAVESLESVAFQWPTDPQRTLEILISFPNLKSIRVGCKDEVRVYHPLLSRLTNLRSMFFLGGRFDAAFFREIKQLPNLRELRIVGEGVTSIANDVPDQLSGFEFLEVLALPSSVVAKDSEIWTNAILAMPTLRSLPSLRITTIEQTEILSSRRNIESLDLHFYLDEKDLEIGLSILANGLKQMTLKSFGLNLMSPTPEIIEAIGNQKELQTLSWNVSSFDGKLYSAWRGLDRLENLTLFSQSTIKELGVMGSLNNLQNLTVFLSDFSVLEPASFGQIKNLRSLNLLGGRGDDELVRSLSQLTMLNKLILPSGVLLSDSGLKSLADCQSLRELHVSGCFSSEGLKPLALLKNLVTVVLQDGMFQGNEISELLELIDLRYCRVRPLDESVKVDIRPDGFWRRKGAIANEQEGTSMKAFLPSDILQECKGSVVLVHLWSTRSGDSLEELPRIIRLRHHFADQNLKLIGIHNDKVNQEQLKRHSIGWPQHASTDQELAKVFPDVSYPSYYLFDRRGVLRVANASLQGLESGIQKLLDESVTEE